MAATTLAVVVALGLAATASARTLAVVNDPPTIEIAIDMDSAALKTGDEIEFTTTVTNTADTPSPDLIVAMNIINLGKSDPVDPEDWSPERTQAVDPLDPGESAEQTWSVEAILDGNYMVYMTAIVKPGTPEETSLPALNPYATGPERLEIGVHQYGLLAGLVASVEYLASLDESATGTRRERLAISMQSAAFHMTRLFDYLLISLQALPTIMVIGRPEASIPVLSFVVKEVPAEKVVQRLADNGVLAIANAGSRVLDVIGVNDIGGAVTVGLAHYSTTAEVDQLIRALASLG